MSESSAIDAYNELGVEKGASVVSVHRSFLKIVTNLVCRIRLGRNVEDLKKRLRIIWIAHDILVDPDCRADYDLRALGIKSEDLDEKEEYKSIVYGLTSPVATPSWRIGELIQAAGLLDKTELDVAADMHKAVPETLFGNFLVKHEFITAAQLQAVLIGQTLIRTGSISLSQYIKIMTEVVKAKRDIKEVLLEGKYIDGSIHIRLDSGT